MIHSEEHQRRSPNCMVFGSRVPLKSRRAETKKARASKVSRLSTQSTITTTSEAAAIADTEANDEELVSSPAMTAKSGKPKASLKSTKSKRPTGRGKTTKPQTEEPSLASSYIEPEDDDFSIKVDPSPKPARKGRKRKSDQMSVSGDAQSYAIEDPVSHAPPAKRRVTRARNSVAVKEDISKQEQNVEDEDVSTTIHETVSVPEVPVKTKGIKSGRKRASSTNRKASMMSTASKASLRVAVPDDDEIEAALELELDRPMTDEEDDVQSAINQQPKGRRLTRTKPSRGAITASVARTRRGTRASTIATDTPIMLDHGTERTAEATETRGIGDAPAYADISFEKQAEPPALQVNTVKKSAAELPSDVGLSLAAGEEYSEELDPRDDIIDSGKPCQTRLKQARSRQVSRQLPKRSTRASNMPIDHETTPAEPDRESSILDAQTLDGNSGHETDASVAMPVPGKHVGRKKPAVGRKGTKGKKAVFPSLNSEKPIDIPAEAREKDQAQSEMLQILPSEVLEDGQAIIDVPEPEKMGNSDIDPASVENRAVDEAEVAEMIHEEPTEPKKQRKAVKTAGKPSKGKKGIAKSKEMPLEPISVPSPTAALPSLQSRPSRPTPAASPQSSDAENQPPSSKPSQLRPPLTTQSPSRSQELRIPLAVSTPNRSPSKNSFSKLQSTLPWSAVDTEEIFQDTTSAGKENDSASFCLGAATGALTSPEMKLTLEQWIQLNAQRGEEKLRAECERLVGRFEGEGMRALKTLEGIVCAE